MRASRRFIAGLAVAATLIAPSPVMGEQPNGELDDGERGSGIRLAGWITAGSGALTLGGAVVTLHLAQDRHASLVADLQAERPTDVSTRRDEVQHYLTASSVLFVVGAAGVATGVTLVLLAPRDAAGPKVAVAAQPGQLTVSGTF